MGWNPGQGLGANNQGRTEIVKVKMKDDNKGLGFKVSEEEWLKTTNQYNELLDQLGGNKEESNANLTSSLEDRSKKSKARVHYHKFTRGKDLSQYSVKDLASIVGPDLVKSIKKDEKDYSFNHVNKGSSTEYFKNKDKQKSNQFSSAEITLDKCDTIFSSTEEEIHYNLKKSKKRTKLKEGSEESFNSSCVSFSGENGKEVTENSSTNPCDNSNNKYSLTEIFSKISSSLEVPIKNRKTNNNCTILDNKSSVHSIESIENYSHTSENSDLPLEAVSNKKETANFYKFKSSLEPFTKVRTKKKTNKIQPELNSRKSNIDEYVQKDNIEMKKENSSINNGLIQQSCSIGNLLYDGVVSKNKKYDNDDLLEMSNHNKEFSETQLSSEVTKVSKKRKQVDNESEIKKKDDSRSFETFKKINLKKNKANDVVEEENCYNNITLVSPLFQNVENPESKSVVKGSKETEEKKILKKKLKKNQLNETDQKIQNKETQITKEEEHSGCDTKQWNEFKVDTTNNDIDYRKEYETEEHLSDPSIAINKYKKGMKVKSNKFKSSYENNSSEGKGISEVYIDPTEHNYKAYKVVILYEYSLLKNILKILNIDNPPEVTFKGCDNLNRASNRKLRLIYRSQQIKGLLPSDKVAEIEQKVKKFSKLVNRRIKIFDKLEEIEKQVAQISVNYSTPSVIKQMDSTKQLNSSEVEMIKKICEQLKVLKIKSTDLISQEENYTKNPVLVATEDGNDTNIGICSEKNKDKKLEDTDKSQCSSPSNYTFKKKLDLLTKQVNQLLKQGKIPIAVSKGDNVKTNGRMSLCTPKEDQFTNTDKILPYQRTNPYVLSETFQSPRLKIGSAQMFGHQRGNAGIGRRGCGLQGSFSFRGRGFNCSRLTYARQYHNSVRGYFRGGNDFRGQGRSERNGFRGRGEQGLRARGRISQNNFDAKQYAEKCKAENKVPELDFKGIDLKMIFGYAASKEAS